MRKFIITRRVFQDGKETLTVCHHDGRMLKDETRAVEDWNSRIIQRNSWSAYPKSVEELGKQMLQNIEYIEVAESR